MNLTDYLEIKRNLREYADNVEESKRPSYTAGSTNVLENFLRDGNLQGIPPMQNWLSHFLKQVAAIISYVRNPDIEPSEPLISRMADLQTYATLGLAVAKDENRKGTGLLTDELVKLINTADESVVASGVFEKQYRMDSDYGH